MNDTPQMMDMMEEITEQSPQVLGSRENRRKKQEEEEQ